jgi:hypothetical protein
MPLCCLFDSEGSEKVTTEWRSARRTPSAQFYIDGRPARQHRDFVESCGVTLPNTAEAHDKLQ